jgi:hypothetical protein
MRRSARPASVAECGAKFWTEWAAPERFLLLLAQLTHPMRSSIKSLIPAPVYRDAGTECCGAQLTKRRMRTFITKPKAKKTKAVDDPP